MPATVIPRRPRGASRVLVASLAAVLALFLLAVVDIVAISARFQRIELTMPTTGGPRTWLVVGLDDRVDIDPEVARYTGDSASQPGTRADIIVVVTQMPDAVRGLSIPRDMLLGTFDHDAAERTINRLANHWQADPQQFIDVICTGLAVPADHVITVNMQALVDVVDAVGGVTVESPYPLLDRELVLEAGPQTLDGITALAYARSREGMAYLDGEWVPEPNGDQMRQVRSAQVLQATIDRLRSRPWLAQAAAWRAAPHIGLDSGSSLGDLLPLLRLESIQTMPMSTEPSSFGKPTTISRRAVAERGYHSVCLAG